MSEMQLANEHMRIEHAYELIGASVDPGRKNYCPFGDFHADGGQSPALRVYPHTNSAYCFACGEAFRPVGLLAKARDITLEEAARLALETVGYIEPDVDDKLDELLADEEPEVSTEELARALDTFCARICPAWETEQLRDGPADAFARCLSILDSVRSADDTARWLVAAKTVMRRTLIRDTPE